MMKIKKKIRGQLSVKSKRKITLTKRKKKE
jgi:hypothetical protein